MSDNKVQLGVVVDANGLIIPLTNFRNELVKIRQEIIDFNAAAKQAFTATGGTASDAYKEVAKQMLDLKKQSESYLPVLKNLETEIQNLKKINQASFDPKIFADYEKKIKDLETELGNLKNGLQTVNTTAKEGGSTFSALKEKLLSVIPGAQGVNAAFEKGRDILGSLKEVISNYIQGLQHTSAAKGTLTTVTNAASGALRLFRVALVSTGIGAIIVLLGSLIAYFTTTQAGIDKVTSVTRPLVAIFQSLLGVLQNVGSYLSGTFANALRHPLDAVKKIGEAIQENLINRIKAFSVFGEAIVKIFKGDVIEGFKGLADAGIQLTTGITNGIDKIGAAAKTTGEFFKEAASNGAQIAKLSKEIEEADIKNTRTKAQLNRLIAENSELARDASKSEKERSEAAKKALAFIDQQTANETKILDLKIKKLKIEQSLNDTSREGQKELAQLEADRDNVAAEAARTKIRLTSTLNNLGKKSAADSAKAAKEAKQQAEKDAHEREATLKRIIALEKEIAEARIGLMDEGREKDIATENDRFTSLIKSLEYLKTLRQTSAEESKLIDKNIEAQKALHNKKLLDIDSKYYEESAKALQSSQDAINAVLLSGQEKELAALNKTFEGLFKTLAENQKKILEATTDPKEREAAAVRYFQRIELLEKIWGEKQVEIANKFANERLKNEQEVAEKTIDLLRVQGLTEEQLTRVKEGLKLEIQKDFAKKRLDELLKQLKLEQQFTAESLAKSFNQSNITESAKQGRDIFDFLGISIDEKDPEKLQKIKEQILDLVGVVNKEKSKEGDLLSFLGFDDTGKQKFLDFVGGISKLGEVAASAMQPFIDSVDRQIEAKQKIIDAIEEQINKQKEAVDREKELLEKGFANNLAIEEQRLSALQKNKDAELAQEKKLQEEKKKLQKAQIIADTFAQGSNLITAATEIFKSVSKIPIVGVGLAIAAIATMLGGFVAAKAQALKAVGDIPKFRKGDRFDVYNALRDAPSHEGGGAGLYDEQTGRKIAEFEGKEKLFIVNRGSSKKYEPVLDAINRDELSNWTYDDLRRFIKPSGISFTGAQVEKRLTNVGPAPGAADPKKATSELLKQIVESNAKIAASNEKLLELEKNKETITDMEDRTIYQRGPYKRIVYKDSKKEDSVSDNDHGS